MPPMAVTSFQSATALRPAQFRCRESQCTSAGNHRVFSHCSCAMMPVLRNGLNTILGPHVRLNAGSPTSVGRPAKYNTLLPLAVRGIRGAWLPVFPRVQPSRLRRLMERAPCRL